MPEAQFYSTSRKWPLAFCFRNLFDRMNCSVGFLVKGTFVEAHAFPKAIPNQREMWDLSAAIEETVLNASQ